MFNCFESVEFNRIAFLSGVLCLLVVKVGEQVQKTSGCVLLQQFGELFLCELVVHRRGPESVLSAGRRRYKVTAWVEQAPPTARRTAGQHGRLSSHIQCEIKRLAFQSCSVAHHQGAEAVGLLVAPKGKHIAVVDGETD